MLFSWKQLEGPLGSNCIRLYDRVGVEKDAVVAGEQNGPHYIDIKLVIIC